MLTIQNLSYHYKKSNPLFRDLQLELAPGNICGLLGKNGAGKTTLLKLITGLLFPKKGEITVLEYTPVDRLPAFLSDIFLIPEEMEVPNIKIATFEKIYAPFYPKFNGAQFDRYLYEFGLEKDRKLHQLSFGQKKKALLSFGLATNCALFIMDEPTNGLDIPSKSQFRSLLAGAITDEKTFLISTHQVRDMSNLIDEIIIVDNGKIIFQENIASVSDTLHFEMRYRESELNGALHAERTPGGFLVVSENVHKQDSEVDIEALFNTVINETQKIQQLFKKEVHHEA